MDIKRISILGGDMRNVELANLLKEDGHEVVLYGFDKLDLFINQSEKLHEAIMGSDVIIGPLPFSEDYEHFNTPFFSGKMRIEDVLAILSKSQILAAGKIPKGFMELGDSMGVNIVDYFAREEMQALNAIPTAEGAIQVAMEEMRTTIHGSNCLVLGYGRIGKSLSSMLYGIGANLFVEARDYADLAWIKNNNYKPIHLKELKYYLSNIDVVFNTIPHKILDEELLEKLKKSAVIIEIASKPGGVDLEAAKDIGVKVINAQGLPGKVAPVTAANVIKQTVYNIMEEVGYSNGS